MSGNDPQGLGDILAQLKQESALGEQLDQARIWERWPEIAGDTLFPWGRPRGVREGRLYVEVEAAVWMNRYSYASQTIVSKVNELAGKTLVTEVFLVLKPEDAGGSQDGA